MKTKVISLKKEEKNTIKELISQNNNVNLILDVSNITISESELEKLFQFFNEHNINGTTFVVVKETVDFDAFSEEWNIVPTINEAEDLISLDEMMRDLE